MNRLIVIPKNKAAEKKLNYDEALADELIEIELNEFESNSLWTEGIFDYINITYHTIIDDFEDEHIFDLTLIKKIYDDIKIKYPHQIKIIEGFHFALIYKTSVHFYL